MGQTNMADHYQRTTEADEADEMTIVNVLSVVREAYDMGYNRFEGFRAIDNEDPIDLSHFKESASWANNVAPELRSMAGNADRGYGTYNERREVIVTNTLESSHRQEGETVDSAELVKVVREAWDLGAYDSLDGEEKGENFDEL